jgi:SAM-dependent methyltransferase
MSGGAPDSRGPAGGGESRWRPARIAETLLEQTHVYRLWQAPFAADKLRPVVQEDDLRQARRVLDVGCGPGTNTVHFQDADYVGIDINPRYVAWARRRHGREFVVADIRTYVFPENQKFDFVLVNSFLHHVEEEEARRILEAVLRTLAPGGTAHILDLVLPEEPSLARWLARHDRGRFARRLEVWRSLFGSIFEVTLFQPYTLSLLGVPLWNMVYCKGQARR